MKTILRNSSGVHELSIEGLLHENRLIFLEGAITSETATSFAKKLLQFYLDDERKKVKVIINSGGGSISAGLMIYDLIQTSRLPIELYCFEQAYSMAAIIFSCGKNGRYILPHSKVMVHEPLITEGGGGNTTSIRKLSEMLTKVKGEMDELIVKHTGKPLAKVKKITSRDTFFTAEEAVNFGLADKIVGFEDIFA